MGMPFPTMPVMGAQPVMSNGFGGFDMTGGAGGQALLMNNMAMMNGGAGFAGMPAAGHAMAPMGLGGASPGGMSPGGMNLAGAGLAAGAPKRMPVNGGMNIKLEPAGTLPAAAMGMGMGMPPGMGSPGGFAARRRSDTSISSASTSAQGDSSPMDDESAAAKRNRGSYRCGKCGEPKKGHICPFRFKTKRRLDEPGPDTLEQECQADMDPTMTVAALKEWAAANGGEPGWIEGNPDVVVAIEDTGDAADDEDEDL
mmetsp:Transcript_6610/g.18828  ORF Transcript_6610/g.18828 Transcript_6610/m.18828 type:complete len:255 (+) Transcript_6610:448-1212(+)